MPVDLRQIVLNRLIEPLGLQAEQLVLRWSETADLRDMDINRIKEGLDLLRDNQYPMDMVPVYENAPLGSKPHQMGLYQIDKGLIDRQGANRAFPELAPRMRNALTSHFETRNIRRNIPGAAAATTAKRILKNKLNMGRRGPLNTISQMMGAPATVRRARKTRRNK